MNPIDAAREQGYSDDQIMNYVSRIFPKAGPRISKAKNAGYSVASILNFIGKSIQGESFDKSLSQSEAHGARKRNQEAVTKKILGGVAGSFAARAAVGLVANSSIGQAIAKRIGQSSPSSAPPPPVPKTPPPPPGGSSGIGPKPMANAPVQPKVPAQPNIAAAAPATAPQELSPEGSARKQVIDKFSAMTPEFREYANAQIAQGLDKPTDQMLRDFNKLKNNLKKAPGFMESFVKDTNQMVRGEGQPEAPRPLEKGTPVATASGVVGNLKSIRNKEALVEDDAGKLHKIKAEDADPIPQELESKDFGSIAKDYLSRFPQHGKESLSTAISLITRNPETDEVYVVFPDSPGSMYIYKNVEPDLYEQILAANTAPKTSGGNSITGSWDVNIADSRGAPFHEIRKNKEKYPFTKVDIGYNMLQRMMEAIKHLRREEASHERKRKKGP